jgi:hypothetical protein
MKMGELIECVGGPWDGKKIPFQAEIVAVPTNAAIIREEPNLDPEGPDRPLSVRDYQPGYAPVDSLGR